MKTIYCFILSVVILSCSEKNEQNEITIHANKTPTENSKIQIETTQVSEIDSSGILMMPLTIGSTREESKFGSSYESSKEHLFWNIIFYHSKTSEKHLLSNDKMLISNFETEYSFSSEGSPEKSDHPFVSKKYIFYKIRTTDANKNGKLDFEDPEYLFYTDRTGKNLKQISKPLTHLVNWTYVKSSNKIIFNAIVDQTKDQKWNEKDETITYEYHLDHPTQPVEIYPQDFKNIIKENFKKNWLN